MTGIFKHCQGNKKAPQKYFNHIARYTSLSVAKRSLFLLQSRHEFQHTVNFTRFLKKKNDLRCREKHHEL